MPPGQILKKLVPEQYQKNDKQVIWKAIEKGDVTKVEKWIKTTKNVNLQNSKGETPLMCAVRTLNLPVIQLLLNNGVDPTLRTYNGTTPCEPFFTFFYL